jgi:hypothetical protein
MKCAHTPCRCRETPVRTAAGAFCSDTCASAGPGGHEGHCPCGHDGCLVVKSAPPDVVPGVVPKTSPAGGDLPPTILMPPLPPI